MLALAISAAIIAGLAIAAASDPDFVKCVKDAIYWLVRAGYEEDKIVQIMHYYVN